MGIMGGTAQEFGSFDAVQLTYYEEKQNKTDVLVTSRLSGMVEQPLS
jgi:hypothetical protein